MRNHVGLVILVSLAHQVAGHVHSECSNGPSSCSLDAHLSDEASLVQMKLDRLSAEPPRIAAPPKLAPWFKVNLANKGGVLARYVILRSPTSAAEARQKAMKILLKKGFVKDLKEAAITWTWESCSETGCVDVSEVFPTMVQTTGTVYTLRASTEQEEKFGPRLMTIMNKMPFRNREQRDAYEGELQKQKIYHAKQLSTQNVDQTISAMKPVLGEDADLVESEAQASVDSAASQLAGDEPPAPEPDPASDDPSPNANQDDPAKKEELERARKENLQKASTARQDVTEKARNIAADLKGRLDGLKVDDKNKEKMQALKEDLEKLQLATEPLKKAGFERGKEAMNGLASEGAEVGGEMLNAAALIEKLGILHGVTLSPFALDPLMTGDVVQLKPQYLNPGVSDTLARKILYASPSKAYTRTYETSSSSEMQLISKTIDNFGSNALTSKTFSLSLGAFLPALPGIGAGVGFSHSKSKSESEKHEKEETKRLQTASYSYNKLQMAFEARSLLVLRRKYLQVTPAFEKMAARVEENGTSVQDLATAMEKIYGTHTCGRLTLGGTWGIRASYTSKQKKTGLDMSSRLTKAIKETESNSASVSGGGVIPAAGVGVTGKIGGGKSTENGNTSTQGNRSVQDFAEAGDDLQVTEEWMGGTSGAGLAQWRNSLQPQYNSNWRIIERSLEDCTGNWVWLRPEPQYDSLKKELVRSWLLKMGMNATDSDVERMMEGETSITRNVVEYRTETCAGVFANGCPSGYDKMTGFDTKKGKKLPDCCTPISCVTNQVMCLPFHKKKGLFYTMRGKTDSECCEKMTCSENIRDKLVSCSAARLVPSPATASMYGTSTSACCMLPICKDIMTTSGFTNGKKSCDEGRMLKNSGNVRGNTEAACCEDDEGGFFR